MSCGEYYCYELYEYEDTYPMGGYRLEPVTIDVGKVLGSTLASSALGAFLNTAIFGTFPPKTRDEWGKFVASFIASGFAGLVFSLLSAAAGGGG